MSWQQFFSFTSLTYGFLCLAVVLLWLPGRRVLPNWMIALLLAIIAGVLSRQLTLIAVILIALFAVAAYYCQPRDLPEHKRQRWLQGFASTGVIVIGGLLAAHLPYFHNLLVINKVYLTPDAIPYTLYLNFDKAVIGIFLLGFSGILIESWQDGLTMMKGIFGKSLMLISVYIALALMVGFVRFDFKIPEFILIWSLANLLLTCVAEEAFFRFFLQGHLAIIFKHIKYGEYVAVTIAAILFGATHYAGGVIYVLMAAAAGLGFGFMYLFTRRIEAAIITHFLLNLVHIIFFTYPALAAR